MEECSPLRRRVKCSRWILLARVGEADLSPPLKLDWSTPVCVPRFECELPGGGAGPRLTCDMALIVPA